MDVMGPDFEGDLQYVERVINSCKTEKQADNAHIWGIEYILSKTTHAHKDLSIYEILALNDQVNTWLNRLNYISGRVKTKILGE